MMQNNSARRTSRARTNGCFVKKFYGSAERNLSRAAESRYAILPDCGGLIRNERGDFVRAVRVKR